MLYTKYVQIGRVVYIAKGKDEGKLAVIVNIVDANKALIDGPSTGVGRTVRNFKDLHLTKFVVPILVGQRSKHVQKAFDDAKITEKFADTNWAKKKTQKTIRAGLNDFERFKVLRAKQLSNRIIRTEFGKLKKLAAKK